jgi:succinate-semialdehyde dehydrogenase / glutarate-semialdehyde dehydrogenase
MTINVINPRTGVADYQITPVTPDELAAKAADMRAAQPQWAALSPTARGDALRALADAMGRHRDALVRALIDDTGRAAISRIEVTAMMATLTRWADQAPALMAEASLDDQPTAIPSITTRTRLVPYALVGVISPWNFPLTLSLIDAIPALAAGSAVLIKPSEITPRFAAPLRAAIAEVPELAPVLALVDGDGAAGAALVTVSDYIAFTGSVATGRKVGEAAARAFIPASLELGGKDPMIVLPDADPEAAAKIALRASVLNNGQACQSIERIYVARSIAEPFLAALVAGAKQARLNYPDVNQGDIGPFIFAKQAEICGQQIQEAVAQGATLLAGGQIENLGGGQYLRPTILTNVTPDMAVMAEESFGPILPVTIYDSVEQAIQWANGGEFGLSGAVIGRDVAAAEAVADQLQVGGVSINDGSLTGLVWEAEKSSFGLSGLGPSRMGKSGLMRFFRKKAIIRQSGEALPLAAYSEEALANA